jgi:tetratricopeptide (TPR) repeat protein
MKRTIALLAMALIAGLAWAAIVSTALARSDRTPYVCAGQDPDKAIAACSSMIANAFDRFDAQSRSFVYVMRGYAYQKKSDFDNAIRDFDEALRYNPNSVMAYYDRAICHHARRDYDRAISDYSDALRLDPNHAEAHADRGVAYMLKGEYGLALQDFEQAVRLRPKDSRSYSNRAVAYLRKGDYDRAIDDYSETIRLDPRLASNYASRGNAYRLKGDYEHALGDINVAIQLAPREALFYDVRCNVYGDRDQYDQAIKDCDEALRLNPNFVPAYMHRGLSWMGKDDVERAIIDFSEAVRLAPNATNIYLYRGFAYEKKGDIEHAKADYATALARPPEDNSGETQHNIVEARTRLAALEAKAQAAAQGVAAMPALPSLERGPRVALVIGNGAYVNVPPLLNPPNDAHDIAGALRELGFKVIEGYDLDGTKMRSKIAEFGAALPGAGVALFYYAGHGMQVAGKNHLVPTDARLERPSALSTEAIEVDSVLADMEAEKRVNLVFLDACRDNPLARSLARSFGPSRSATVTQGLAQLNSGIGTLITFATSPDTVALDGDGRNSPFTAALLKYIRTPGLEVRSMLTRVRAEVIRATREKQVPWDHSSLTGEFYFKQGG